MKSDRLNRLDAYVRRKKVATIAELSDYFGTSVNTVRRDIHELVGTGEFKKVYGGIALLNQMNAPSYAQRSTEQMEEKYIIGQLAATLVQDDMVIFLDSGSTTPYMLEPLSRKSNITVITYSLSVLTEAAKYPSLRVIALGGLFDHRTASFSGSQAISELAMTNVHIAFLSATCVSLSFGLSNYSYREADIKSAVSSRCSNVVLVADHSKFDRSGMKSFFPFERLSAVVTDRPLPEPYRAVMARNNISLLCPDGAAEDSTGA